MYASVVIVAAGKGKRMGTDIKKQYLKLNGKEVLAHTIQKFEDCNEIDEIIIVTGKEEIEYCTEHIWKKYDFSKIKKIVPGGKERQDSVYNGLLQVGSQTDIVLIHDGARPLVRNEQIKGSIETAMKEGGCVIGVPVKDTVKICDSKQFVKETPLRDTLWVVQTPQTFKYNLIMGAYKDAFKKGLVVTDDSMMVEALGYRVKVVQGCYDNIKITTPEDLVIAKSLMS